MFEGKTILTGVKPTGTPHIGNYLGAIKPMIEFGKTAQKHFMFVADYHAINAEKDPETLKRLIKEVSCVYLACGLDPKKSIFYRQSDIPEIPEITTILYAYTPKGFMNKSHAYKAFVDKNREAGKPDDDSINMGLFTYPTLMAADILSFGADVVPVGKDQVQHVEIARDIAGAVNAHYNEQLLKLPEYYLRENVDVVPGLDGRKMSKSYGNVVPIFDTDKNIKKAVFSIKTDSRLPEEPKDPESVLVYQVYKAIATPEKVAEMAEDLKNGKMGYGTAKNLLLEAIIGEISDKREQYNYYMSHFDEVMDMLHDGAKKARPIAKLTLEKLKTTIFGNL